MFLSDLRSKIFWMICALLFPIEVWAAVPVKPVEIRLEGEVMVGGETVLLGDVATIYAKSLRDFNALSSLTISSFPEGGSEIRLPQAYLENRIREALPPGTEFRLNAPSLVTFRLEKLGISPDEFFRSLIAKAKAEGKIPEWAEVKVEPVGGFDQLKTWKLSEVRIDPVAEMARWKGDLSFKVAPTGQTNGNLAWVKVKFRWFANVWQARRGLSIMQSVSPADFSAERIEITNLREDPILATEDLKELIGNSRAKRALSSGSPLTVGVLEKSPDARPGQAVQVVFVSESGIRVTTEGAVLGNGSIGDDIRVKLRTSRKTVTGKLVSNGMMEVTL